MQANNWKDMHKGELLLLTMRSNRKVRRVLRSSRLLSSFLGFVLLLACSFGCAPAKQSSSASESNGLPELTDEMIRQRINDAFVREVPEENGAAEPISWSFDEEEPKEVSVIKKQMDGERATILLDIKTRSALEMRNPRYLEGQIRTEWVLKTGWALRKWEIVGTENISMKYKNLPKMPAQNSNR